jgi:hypothetical protein
LAKPISLEQLKSMSVEELANLHRNAVKLGTPAALAVIDNIIKHNLLVTHAGGLPHDHPVILRIEEIVTSPDGRAAAKRAADSGLPALAGVDPMLHKALGDDYDGRFDTTSWAGTFVAAEMRKLGYTAHGERPLPTGCVAKSGLFFRSS